MGNVYPANRTLAKLVVVGDQSSGKSSVLEGLTDIPFPRDSGLCTRFATQITFRRALECRITVSIIPSPAADLKKQESLRAFKIENLTSLSGPDFLDILAKVR
jgi:GTPase SAR1 family protein